MTPLNTGWLYCLLILLPQYSWSNALSSTPFGQSAFKSGLGSYLRQSKCDKCGNKDCKKWEGNRSVCTHRALTTVTSFVMRLISNRQFNFEKHLQKVGFLLCYYHARGKRNARGIPQIGISFIWLLLTLRGRQPFEVPISLRVKKKSRILKEIKLFQN